MNSSVFLHIPKCSGWWIRDAIKACGISHVEFGDIHSTLPELLREYHIRIRGNNLDNLWCRNLLDFDKRFLFMFVRHPLTWYQSRWVFRLKRGWESNHQLDFNCASNDFHAFVENAIKYKSNGWVTHEFLNFIDTTPRPVDFIGRVEYLRDDLIFALRAAGETFDESIIRTLEPVNDSNIGGFPSKYWATYTPELVRKVLAADSEIINRYYRNYDIDIDSFCKPRPY